MSRGCPRPSPTAAASWSRPRTRSPWRARSTTSSAGRGVPICLPRGATPSDSPPTGSRPSMPGSIAPSRAARRAAEGRAGRRSRFRARPEGQDPLVTSCYKRRSRCHTGLMAWNVVIAGGGFGGANVARRLERTLPRQSARLMLVNDVNFLLYTPFLPEAAAGLLEPRHVVTPLREILHRTYLRLGAITAHDPAARTVELRTHEGETQTYAYDQLVLSLGSVSRTVPVPGLAEHAIGFKSLADAIWLRNHVVETLEEANASEDAAKRERLLTYVFVGGGYAGLEALAELQDFAVDAMDAYPRARLHGMRWILVEATQRVLPEIDEKLADYAVRELRGRGIEIRLGTTIEGVDAESTTLSTGEAVPTRTLVWTAGVKPHPSLRHLSLPLDERGRVQVDDRLAVKGMDGVWAIGDCAAVPDRNRGLSPPAAQYAIRQAKVAAANVASEL